MNNFSLLSPSMQRRIWRMGWPALNEVQEAAIPVIMKESSDVVIAAETASGKTEAAFLPLLSLIESTYAQGIKVIYVSPLKALINDQFARIQSLCDETGIPVHRYHGDVSQTAKRRTISAPAGILQITPESIESLFINRSGDVPRLFSAIEFMVIDEIHAFLGTDRGTHLRSLMARAQSCSKFPLRYIGLSATVGDYGFVQGWLRKDEPERVHILVPDGPRKANNYCVMYFPSGEDGKRPLELYEDMRELTRNHSALIFCNARGEVEETVYTLNRFAERDGDGNPYLPHHSSIDAAERQYVEERLKTADRPLSVVATSTLEMGIDIGSVDLVIQIDSTFTVSSLKQRLGRSGRRPGAPRVFQLYSTSDADLLQAIAVTELFLEGWVEPPEPYALPYDVLFHQILSISAEKNGISLDQLLGQLRGNEAFSPISELAIRQLLQHMLEKDYLERIGGTGELIVGLDGERILRSRDFYAVFETADMYEVIHNTRTIGTLTRTMEYIPGSHLILAGKVWSIVEVDSTRSKIYVRPANTARRPYFGGDPVPVSHAVRTKMAEVLYGNKQYPYLYGQAAAHLEGLRIPGRLMGLTPNHRLLEENGRGVTFHSFAGDRVARTLAAWIELETELPVAVGRMGVMTWASSVEQAEALLRGLSEGPAPDPDGLADRVPPEQLLTTKFGAFVPEWAKRQMHASAVFDVEATAGYLRSAHVRVAFD